VSTVPLPAWQRLLLRLRRLDTLFLRLFLLMWLTLVAASFFAFALSIPLAGDGPAAEHLARLQQGALPPMPSLPPGGLLQPGPPMAVPTPTSGPAPEAAATGAGPDPRLGGPPSALPSHVLWVDYGLRVLVIGLGAWLGARWLARPMQRLSGAAQTMGQALTRGAALPQLEERLGTAEVRAAAAVFNTMAQRLQEQFDARGMHLAALSHDLRTPLTRLRMRLEDASPELAEAAAGDIHAMTEMMDGTLAVLREQREGSAPDLVDLRSLLEALVDDQAVAGHAVALAAGQAPRVRARPAALRRALDNLVGNALRYGGSAQLALQAGAEPGWVVVTVDDRGPGIPEHQLELAFKPWVRLQTSHARAGHGLGLAIARDLAERDGGRLTLHNRAQGGLRATLSLPLATQHGPEG
jgi:protein-histidine pros-kinase